MVTAVVLIKAETGKVPELAQTMAELEGVSEVFSVAGQYDLVALVRVRENEDLARVISEKMRKSEFNVQLPQRFCINSNQESIRRVIWLWCPRAQCLAGEIPNHVHNERRQVHSQTSTKDVQRRHPRQGLH